MNDHTPDRITGAMLLAVQKAQQRRAATQKALDDAQKAHDDATWTWDALIGPLVADAYALGPEDTFDLTGAIYRKDG